jgi:hypothetical protein
VQKSINCGETAKCIAAGEKLLRHGVLLTFAISTSANTLATRFFRLSNLAGSGLQNFAYCLRYNFLIYCWHLMAVFVPSATFFDVSAIDLTTFPTYGRV